MDINVIKTIAELGVLVVIAGVFISQQRLLFKETTNTKEVIEDMKDVLKEIKETIKEMNSRSEAKLDTLEQKILRLEKGYVNNDNLKDIAPYIIQSSRWKIQNTVTDIININNIAKNYEIVMKKTTYCFDREINKLNYLLNNLTETASTTLISNIFKQEIDTSKTVIVAVLDDLRNVENKEEYITAKNAVELEMNQFENNVVSKINSIL